MYNILNNCTNYFVSLTIAIIVIHDNIILFYIICVGTFQHNVFIFLFDIPIILKLYTKYLHL